MSREARNSLAALAGDTLSILQHGGYEIAGHSISIREEVECALAGTSTHSPSHLDDLSARPRASGPPKHLEVAGETTLAAAGRLLRERPGSSVVALNFASARSPGGGFLGGARAQEESLCRASALYPTLLRAPRYYDENRASVGTLYTDWAIHSPEVPVFRDDTHALLDDPFLTSFITMPAPNRGAMREPREREIAEVFSRRVDRVFALAREKGHDTIVLGAWGCGAFRNDPGAVAHAFREAIFERGWGASFERITFAVFDGKREGNLATFESVLRS